MIKKSKIYFDGLGIPLYGIRKKAVCEFNELVYEGKIRTKEIVNCFCENPDFELLSRYDRYGLPFGTQICTNCGLISQTRGISEESMEIFYNKLYWPMNTGSEDPNLNYTPTSSLSELSRFLLPIVKFTNKKISVLEVGCGNGIRLKHIKNLLSDQYDVGLIGCDYSNESLKIASSKGIEVIQGGMESALKRGPVDILVLSHVFEHFPNIQQSLELIENLTHEDSIIYVEVPGVNDLLNRPEYDFNYQKYTVLAHIHNFSLSTLSKVFSTKGFKLVKGNEYIRAIFKKKVENPQSISQNPYNDIMESLQKAIIKNHNHNKKLLNPSLRYVKGIIKAFFGKNN